MGCDEPLPEVKRKVYAYITHADRLLIFSHPDFPEAGVQVPGGTLEEDEDPDDGILREAMEETGLSDLRIDTLLGEIDRRLPELGQVHHRWFYHLVCPNGPPERWYHYELYPSDGSPAPIRFEFYWVSLPNGVPELSGDLGQMLPTLLYKLHLSGAR
jgi:8-oxo-dGTP diphosphatase